MRNIGGVSTNRLLYVLETLLSFRKYFLANTFSQNIDHCSEAFSLLFSIFGLSQLKRAAQARTSLHLSICHIVGNHVSRFNFHSVSVCPIKIYIVCS